MVVARALLLGVPVTDDQGVDGDQQERLEVGVFSEACKQEPGVKSTLGYLGGSAESSCNDLCLGVASLLAD